MEVPEEFFAHLQTIRSTEYEEVIPIHLWERRSLGQNCAPHSTLSDLPGNAATSTSSVASYLP
jgi:hypothetical protein